ncbi:VanZ family protein [Streptomyces sp. NPDC006879]|uniref:VanZ family protein n=1 Tax=Streptomyces sp. NPDC006879 TaxID=3364767 RepID=UPI0036A1DE90
MWFRAVGVLVLLAHLAAVGWFALRPLDVPWAAASNHTPLAGIRADLSYGPLGAARRIGAALLLFAPLGVLLPVAGGRLEGSAVVSLARTVAAGALLSLLVELVRTAVPGQVADVDSVLLGGVGIALAHLALVPPARALLRRCRGVGRGGPGPVGRGEDRFQDAGRSRTSAAPSSWSVPQGATPRIPRVRIAP